MPVKQETVKSTEKNTKRKSGLKEPWKKGQSGNPNGRPKKEVCIPDILRKILHDQNKYTLDKETNLEGICRIAIDQALSGDKDARNFIADRTEGKAIERVLTQKTRSQIILE